MDIRTKLIFTLVAVALSSMAVLGAVMVPEFERRLRNERVHQLDQLAEAKRESLVWIVEGWIDRTEAVARLTDLAAPMGAGGVDGGSTLLTARLRTAVTNTEGIATLALFDVTGVPIASAVSGDVPATNGAVEWDRSPPDRITFEGVTFASESAPHVRFAYPLSFQGRVVGTLVAVFEANELLSLTGHHHELGETGEIMLIAEDETGAPRSLHPTRHAPSQPGGVVLPRGAGTLADQALRTERSGATEGLRDYRGELVWVATRSEPLTGWGVIVKVDAAEQAEPFAAFRASIQRTALVLSAFAILAGFGLGLRFAMPIHQLASMADRIRKGDLQARATVHGEDEVSLLARTFNEMASDLERRLLLLIEYRKFFDVSIDMLCIAGTDGFFKRVNPAFERSLGWTEEELLDRPFFDFVHPGDIEKTEQEVLKLADGIPTISFENRYLCKDGNYRQLRWTSYPDPETGMLYAIAHLVHDAPVPAEELPASRTEHEPLIDGGSQEVSAPHDEDDTDLGADTSEAADGGIDAANASAEAGVAVASGEDPGENGDGKSTVEANGR